MKVVSFSVPSVAPVLSLDFEFSKNVLSLVETVAV